MDFNTFKNLVIAKCEELGITEYELYYQAAESTSIAAFQHEINQFTSSIEGGVCFRCIVKLSNLNRLYEELYRQDLFWHRVKM